jgi:hypothetical protein
MKRDEELKISLPPKKPITPAIIEKLSRIAEKIREAEKEEREILRRNLDDAEFVR